MFLEGIEMEYLFKMSFHFLSHCKLARIIFWEYRKGTLTRYGSRSFTAYFNVFQNDEKKNSDRGFLKLVIIYRRLGTSELKSNGKLNG